MKDKLKEFSQLWEDARSLKDRDLLRLSILRDLSRRFHAERMVDQERHLEWIRDAQLPLEAPSLESLLRVSGPAGDPSRSSLPVSPALSPALARIIPAEKLERYDRKWEAHLSRLAMDRGWMFWAMEAELAAEKAEIFHQSLASRLWPHSILLFVENATVGAPRSRDWNGRWIWVSTPEFDPRALKMTELAVPPSWRRLGP